MEYTIIASQWVVAIKVSAGLPGLEPAILDWYGYCVCLVNRLGGSGGMLPREKCLKLDTLRSFLRPRLGQNGTRISPPVVSVAREAIEPSCQK